MCFHSKLFGVKTSDVLAFRELTSVRRMMTDLINPAIQLCTATHEHLFASFFFRDHTHAILDELWRIQLQLHPAGRAPLSLAMPSPYGPSADGAIRSVAVTQGDGGAVDDCIASSLPAATVNRGQNGPVRFDKVLSW